MRSKVRSILLWAVGASVVAGCVAPAGEDQGSLAQVTERTGPSVAPEDRILIDVLRDHVRHVLRLNHTPGLNLALARRGAVVWEAGFGMADVASRTPMTPDAVTHSGSMGKTYTATAVMQLVEREILELDAPVNRYLSGWTIDNPFGGREVTVRDLLTHRSGLVGNAAFSVYDPPRPLREHVPSAYGRTHFKPYGGDLVPLWGAAPGQVYAYSNLGIATLGYLVETTNPDSLTFSDWVQVHVMDPLGMTSSQYPPAQDSIHVRPDIWSRTTTGYARFGPLVVPTPPIYFEDHPAGTVVTTPADHVRLLLAMMHGGTLDGREILTAASVEEMLRPQDGGGPEAAQGLVWRLSALGEPGFAFGHGGAHMWGWTNQFIAFPTLDAALAISMNNWDLPADPGARYREALAIIRFVRSWLENDRHLDPRATSGHTWAWKYSYVAGMLMAERNHGALGIEEPTTDAMMDAMLAGARTQGPSSVPVWDPEGFRAGFRDMTAVEMEPEAIRAFYVSDRIRILPEELALLMFEMGGDTTVFGWE